MKTKKLLIICGALLLALIILAVVAVRFARSANPRSISLDLGGGATLELVRIPAGIFRMGSPDREPGHDASESPIHTVEIKPFYLGQFEVTQAQWQAIMNSTQSAFPGDGKRPADSMSWSDAQKFCKYASEKTGKKLRLPTEAEWEFACRAGTTTPWNSGSALGEAVFKPAIGFAPVQPALVGSKLPNDFGLYDMHGNLAEWCQDYFWPNYDKAPTDGSAVTTPPKLAEGDQPSRVYRGGSWRSRAEECRSAVRFAAGEETRSDTLGFRVAMDAR